MDKLADFFQCFSKGDPCLSGRIESLTKFAALLELDLDIEKMADPEKALYLPSMFLSELLFEIVEEEEETLASPVVLDESFGSPTLLSEEESAKESPVTISPSSTESPVSSSSPKPEIEISPTKKEEVSPVSSTEESPTSTMTSLVSESDSSKETETVQKKITKENISSEVVRKYLLDNPDQIKSLGNKIQENDSETAKRDFLEYLETRKLYKKDDEIDWQALVKGLVSSETYFQEWYNSAWAQTKDSLRLSRTISRTE